MSQLFSLPGTPAVETHELSTDHLWPKLGTDGRAARVRRPSAVAVITPGRAGPGRRREPSWLAVRGSVEIRRRRRAQLAVKFNRTLRGIAF